VGFVYWSSLAGLVARSSSPEQRRRWLAPGRGHWLWAGLALVMGLIAFPLLLIPNLELLRSPLLAALWLGIAVVNGSLEELYWRGLLLDAFGRRQALGVAYTAILFTAIHPLMWGVFSRPMAFVPFWGIVAAISLAYSVIYLNTRSLRWPILSHILSDIGNLSIFVFMNLVPFPS
jgi:membrane protease YdiL (CAAX protease family)